MILIRLIILSKKSIFAKYVHHKLHYLLLLNKGVIYFHFFGSRLELAAMAGPYPTITL